MALQKIIAAMQPELTEEQLNILQKAYDVALQAHEDQKRKSGEPYIIHPLAVAEILAQDLEMDFEAVIAGILHDVIEDSPVTMEELEEIFGKNIALLVDGVTKLTRIKEKTHVQQQALNLHKMFLAMASDIRVVIIKLADRLHNMRTLQYRTVEKQKTIAQETLDIYAPLASRLGMYSLKSDLEDLSFRYLKPEYYKEIRRLVDRKRSERTEFVSEIITTLRSKLEEQGIKAEITGRPKHFYSIYKKMTEKDKSFDEIFDLTAVRVIVDTSKDCYSTLGVVHTLWTPLPGRFKDYIAMPKPNRYQSLHTTVIGMRKAPIEIQIRTREMHQIAEYGVAAHWKYKEGISSFDSNETKFAWLRQVLEFQQELKDVEEFVNSLKVDLFADQVFVFTPKGDVIDLPSGATPIDLAYRIHTAIGNRCIGAKVNNAIVNLDYQLKTGDIVNILTSKSANGPSRDWLKIARTSSARSRIRQWFKREQREENIERGQAQLNAEIKKLGYSGKSIINNKEHDFTTELIEDLNYVSFDDLLASIGYGNQSAISAANKLIESYRNEYEPESLLVENFEKEQKNTTITTRGVSIQGIDNALLRIAKCCHPIPGDNVIGYITRGKGVTIHRKECSNIPDRADDADRFIDVIWDEELKHLYPVPLQITVSDRPGAIYDILGAISILDINIAALNARGGIVYVTLELQNLEQLDNAMRRISSIKDIHQVRRI